MQRAVAQAVEVVRPCSLPGIVEQLLTRQLIPAVKVLNTEGSAQGGVVGSAGTPMAPPHIGSISCVTAVVRSCRAEYAWGKRARAAAVMASLSSCRQASCKQTMSAPIPATAAGIARVRSGSLGTNAPARPTLKVSTTRVCGVATGASAPQPPRATNTSAAQG